jgi:hypothetical protein
MNMNTPDSTPNAEGRKTQKIIEAVGCRFVEYRGEGMPVRGNPLASPGDVYFDVKEQPYTAWVCQQDSKWNQWRSMAEGRNCKHPKQDRILYPSVQRLAWVPMSGYDAYLRQTKLRLGKWNNVADTHIKIILDHERGVKYAPPPPRIEAPSPDRTPPPDLSDEDDEVQQLAIAGSDSAEDGPNNTEAEIIAEACADLENRCRIMRVQDDDIQRALITSSGMQCMYDLPVIVFSSMQ